ncbi:MAG: 3,4-dihydroxy-2-butanone-4-phosphate synthase [Saprospiraceae bacterium]|nr:3,4-dihydroxy-2-butanone-4-phosphate synthase [Saprospiraceae bacterium]
MIDMPITDIQLNTIEEAIEDIKAGKVIIVVDDEDRENEGDFVCAAECVTPEIINFMATHGRGLICTPITEERAEELELAPMVRKNTDLHGTAFTISIDYLLRGCTTGISAYDRSTGIKALTEEGTKGSDYARPGHIFPLVARKGGVLRRTGHTEASIDLASLAGLYPAAVLVEILNPDGTMARLPQLAEIAAKFDLKLITIKDLVAYRMERERLVKRSMEMEIETPLGKFDLIAFTETNENITHLALKTGSWKPGEPVLTRVQAATNANELLALILGGGESNIGKCLKRIKEEENGLLLLLRYPEQQMDLLQSLEILKEQQEKGGKMDAYLNRPKNAIQKDLGIGAQILHDLGVRKLRLLTNRPRKRIGLIGYGLEVVDEVSM